MTESRVPSLHPRKVLARLFLLLHINQASLILAVYTGKGTRAQFELFTASNPIGIPRPSWKSLLDTTRTLHVLGLAAGQRGWAAAAVLSIIILVPIFFACTL